MVEFAVVVNVFVERTFGFCFLKFALCWFGTSSDTLRAAVSINEVARMPTDPRKNADGMVARSLGPWQSVGVFEFTKCRWVSAFVQFKLVALWPSWPRMVPSKLPGLAWP